MSLRVPVATAVLALAAGMSASAADGGWTVLFDGKDTSAFRGYNRPDFPAACWTIDQGTLKTVTVERGQGPCDLVTKDKYRDFELELDYRLTKGGNSGVMYRVVEKDKTPAWHSGPEVQILDDDSYRENSPKNWTAALYDLLAAEGKTVKPVGEWNTLRLVVKGNHAEHWLNGKKVVEYELGSPALKALIAGSKFKDMPEFAAASEGYVALQHHDGGDVWFRNVRIRALK